MGAAALELLVPLLKKRDTWYILVIAVLAVLFWISRGRYRADELALAARPKVETHVETRTVTKVVQGPERVVEKLVQGQVVERVVYRDPVTTTTGTEKSLARETAPACPAAPALPWREVSAVVDPLSATKLVGLDASATFGGRFVLGAGGRLDRGGEGHVRMGVRF